jgi:hypothetical protein
VKTPNPFLKTVPRVTGLQINRQLQVKVGILAVLITAGFGFTPVPACGMIDCPPVVLHIAATEMLCLYSRPLEKDKDLDPNQTNTFGR